MPWRACSVEFAQGSWRSGLAQRSIYPAVPLPGILIEFLHAPVGIDRYTFVPGELMAFPDVENSIVTEDKLCDYLLNPSHPVGGPKAAWFASIGYTRENWTEFRDDLLAMAALCENFVAKPSPYGVKYETVGDLGTEGHRPGTVVAVWIVEENFPPRLVTAYPGNG